MSRTSTTGAIIPWAGLFLIITLLVSAVAAASPQQSIADARAEAGAARDRMEDLAADLEERSEEYYAVERELEGTRAKIRVAEDELVAAVLEVQEAESRLNERAGSIYRSGKLDIVSVFLGVTDFRDFVSRMDLLRRIGRNDAVLVARVKEARASAERTRSELENRRTEQSALLRTHAEKRSAVNQALQAQKKYLATVDKRLHTLIAQERERQERIARERAQRAAAEAAARAAASAPRAVDRSRPFDPASLPAPKSAVVNLARKFIGVTPYVWGGTTPAGFDCSGLILYCYRSVGVSLPRTSREQFRAGSYIPPDRLDLLAPGDLVFFGTDGDPGRVHHVGIYSGNGDFIHAPYTGALVSENSLIGRIESRGDYVGATRP